jgi:protein NrfC
MSTTEKITGAEPAAGQVTRRDFLKWSGIVVISVGAGGIGRLAHGAAGVPQSQGYLLVDTKKCQGCMTCMLACSLAHEGRANLSLARIQVVQDPFEKFPADITQVQCRQCPEPACLNACPTGALHADSANGNVRMVDYDTCNGCKACIAACPFTPGRTIWNFIGNHAQKCDLCVNTPYWTEKGGPGGTQACVKMCPLGAISFTAVLPTDYQANLRGTTWGGMGYPMD